MVTPDFKSISYQELLDYALTQGEGCGALEEYIKRQSQDSNTVTLNPHTDPNWLNKLLEMIQERASEPLPKSEC